MQILQQLKNRLGQQDRVLARGTTVALVGVGLTMIMGLVLAVFKAQVLDKYEFGVLQVATSITFTTFFFTTGFSITMVRFGSLFSGQGDEGKIKSVVLPIYKLTLASTTVLVVLLNLATPFICTRIFDNAELIPLVRLISIGALFQAVTFVNTGLLKSKYLVKYEYIAVVGQAVVITVFALLFLRFENLVTVFAAGWPVAALAFFVYTSLVVKREFPYLFDRSVKTSPHGEKPFRFAMFSSLTTALSKFHHEINIFLIAFFLSEADVAVYTVALKAAFLPLILSPAVNAIFPPMVSTFYGMGDLVSIRKLFVKVIAMVVGFALCFSLIYLVAGKYILLIFGNQYLPALTALIIMALANVAIAASGPMSFTLSMLGRPHINSINSSLLLILISGLCYYLIPRYGINGAASAYAVANGLICGIYILQMGWLYRLETRKAAAA